MPVTLRGLRTTLATLTLLAGGMVLAGCGEGVGSLAPCSPSLDMIYPGGHAHISQPASGQDITYSIYDSDTTANASGSWTVRVYMNGSQMQGYSQTGNPIGKVLPAVDVVSGGVLTVNGWVTWTTNNDQEAVGRFQFNCRS